MKLERTVLEAKRYGVYRCGCQATLLQAARDILEHDVSALVVVDETGYLAGIISRTDLLRACTIRDDWMTQLVCDFMSTDVVTVYANTPLRAVAELLLQNHIHRVVVVRPEEEGKRPIAVISDGDFIYHMVKEA